jgi:guanylate kinase
MIVIVGPSASGKTEVVKYMTKDMGYQKIPTYTTRPMRVNEINDVDYHFITESEFKDIEKRKGFLESVRYHDNFYGTRIEHISDYGLLIVNLEGLLSIYEKYHNKIFYVIFSTDENVRRSRMVQRGDSIKDIEQRILKERTYFNESILEKYNFVNLSLDTTHHTIEELSEIVHSKYQIYKKQTK